MRKRSCKSRRASVSSTPQGRRPRTLASFLARHGVRQPDEITSKLIALASAALPPTPNRLTALQRTLLTTVDLRQCLVRNAHVLPSQAALLLASTSYAMLTSIPGIGFTLASGMAAKLGDPSRLSKVDSLCAFAGFVPHAFQSGGPDSPAAQGHAPRPVATTSSRTGRFKARKKSISTARLNSRTVSPVGMPTASMASSPPLVATCVSYALLSSTRSPIWTL